MAELRLSAILVLGQSTALVVTDCVLCILLKTLHSTVVRRDLRWGGVFPLQVACTLLAGLSNSSSG